MFSFIRWDKKSVPIFRKVIKLCDEAEKTEFNLGLKANSLIYLNEADDARVVFNEILNEFPNNINALVVEAKFLIADEEHNQALEIFDRILDIDNDNFDALMHKGELLMHFNKYTDALNYIDRALTINPNVSYIWYLKGKYESEVNSNYNLALKYFDDALRLDKSIVYYIAKATALSELGRLDEVKDLVAKIIKMKKENEDKHWEVISHVY